MGKHIAWLLLLVAAAPACSRAPNAATQPAASTPPQTAQPDFVKDAGIDKSLMDRAMAKARETQGEFVAALTSQRLQVSNFFIKKQLGDQHVWLEQVAWDGEAFSAVVSNVPSDAAKVKPGERVVVQPGELSDWMYVEDGVLRGGYTVRVLHYQSTPKEQEATLRNQDFTIPPIDF